MRTHANRRRVLKGIGATGIAGLAGCSSGDGENESNPEDNGGGTTAGTTQSQAPDSIKLGASLALSGDSAANSVEFRAAIEAMVDWWNSNGGIHVEEYGQKIPVEYVLYDDEGDKQRAITLYNRLISQDDVDIMHLPYLSEITFSVVPIIEDAGVPAINIGASGSDIVELFDTAVYSIVTPTSKISQALAEAAAAAEPQPKIGILTPNHPTAKLYAESMNNWADKVGVESETVATYSLDTSDLSSSLTKAQDSNVDFLYNVGPPPTNILFVNQAYDFGGWDWIGVGGGLSSPALIDGVGADRTRGIVGPTPWHHKLPYPGVDTFTTRFAEKYEELSGSAGATPSKYSGPPAGGMQALKKSIEAAGTLEKSAVREQMAAGTFSETILGEYSFDDNNVITPARSFAAQWRGESKSELGLEIIAPDEAATEDPLYPLPQFQ